MGSPRRRDDIALPREVSAEGCTSVASGSPLEVPPSSSASARISLF